MGAKAGLRASTRLLKLSHMTDYQILDYFVENKPRIVLKWASICVYIR